MSWKGFMRILFQTEVRRPKQLLLCVCVCVCEISLEGLDLLLAGSCVCASYLCSSLCLQAAQHTDWWRSCGQRQDSTGRVPLELHSTLPNSLMTQLRLSLLWKLGCRESRWILQGLSAERDLNQIWLPPDFMLLRLCHAGSTFLCGEGVRALVWSFVTHECGEGIPTSTCVDPPYSARPCARQYRCVHCVLLLVTLWMLYWCHYFFKFPLWTCFTYFLIYLLSGCIRQHVGILVLPPVPRHPTSNQTCSPCRGSVES